MSQGTKKASQPSKSQAGEPAPRTHFPKRFAQLKSMFPNTSDETIQEVLEESSGDVDKAANKLTDGYTGWEQKPQRTKDRKEQAPQVQADESGARKSQKPSRNGGPTDGPARGNRGGRRNDRERRTPRKNVSAAVEDDKKSAANAAVAKTFGGVAIVTGVSGGSMPQDSKRSWADLLRTTEATTAASAAAPAPVGSSSAQSAWGVEPTHREEPSSSASSQPEQQPESQPLEEPLQAPSQPEFQEWGNVPSTTSQWGADVPDEPVRVDQEEQVQSAALSASVAPLATEPAPVISSTPPLPVSGGPLDSSLLGAAPSEPSPVRAGPIYSQPSEPAPSAQQPQQIQQAPQYPPPSRKKGGRAPIRGVAFGGLTKPTASQETVFESAVFFGGLALEEEPVDNAPMVSATHPAPAAPTSLSLHSAAAAHPQQMPPFVGVHPPSAELPPASLQGVPSHYHPSAHLHPESQGDQLGQMPGHPAGFAPNAYAEGPNIIFYPEMTQYPFYPGRGLKQTTGGVAQSGAGGTKSFPPGKFQQPSQGTLLANQVPKKGGPSGGGAATGGGMVPGGSSQGVGVGGGQQPVQVQHQHQHQQQQMPQYFMNQPFNYFSRAAYYPINMVYQNPETAGFTYEQGMPFSQADAQLKYGGGGEQPYLGFEGRHGGGNGSMRQGQNKGLGGHQQSAVYSPQYYPPPFEQGGQQ